MTTRNYYRILQVDPSAEPEVIHAAYKRLALKYHPDTNPDKQSTAKMQEINEAYNVLSDPHQRLQYDNFIKQAAGNLAQRPPSQQERREHADRVIGASFLANFISASMLLIVLVGFIFRKIGLVELIIIIILAVVITMPRIRQLEKYFRRRK